MSKVITLVKFGKSEEVTVEEGQTVAGVLAANDIPLDSVVRLKGKTVDGDETELIAYHGIEDGDTIAVAPAKVSHGA